MHAVVKSGKDGAQYLCVQMARINQAVKKCRALQSSHANLASGEGRSGKPGPQAGLRGHEASAGEKNCAIAWKAHNTDFVSFSQVQRKIEDARHQMNVLMAIQVGRPDTRMQNAGNLRLHFPVHFARREFAQQIGAGKIRVGRGQPSIAVNEAADLGRCDGPFADEHFSRPK